MSTDKGVTYTVVFTFPTSANTLEYDYPHIVFGVQPGQGYGVWTYGDYFTLEDNLYVVLAFTPISNSGPGTTEVTYLDSLVNGISVPSIAASDDGRFWAVGNPNYVFPGANTYQQPQSVIFKSAGPLDSNYAGPWIGGTQTPIALLANLGITTYSYNSVPQYGFLPVPTVRGLIYDNELQALYLLYYFRTPSFGQNSRLAFAISRNNGQTWTRILDLSTTFFANRGFTSMALDEKTGDITFGWYDGRNDPKQQELQYMGAKLKYEKLKGLVDKIPLGNPVYLIPGQGVPCPP